MAVKMCACAHVHSCMSVCDWSMSLVSREADCGPRKQGSDLCDVGNEDLFPLFPCGIHHLKTVPKITECTAKYSIHIRADKLKAHEHKNGKKSQKTTKLKDNELT